MKHNLFKQGLLVVFVTGLILSLWTSFPSQHPQVVNADEQGNIMVSSSYEERRGNTVKLSVLLANVDYVASGSFELHYDSDVGYITDTEKGELLPDDVMFVENTDQARDGVVKVAWASTDSLGASDGSLYNFYIRVMHSRSKDTTELKLENVHLFDKNGNEIYANVVNGFIKPFDGVKKEEKKGIASDKSWKVTFNTPMKRSTLNPHTIFVVNDKDERIPVKVNMSKDKKSVTVQPVGHYIKGTYTLTITNQLQSIDGKQLKKAIELPFTVN